jgi:hypothetical protein
MTTTTVQPAFPPIDIAGVENALNAVQQVLPMLTTFFPPLKVAVPLIPIIEGLLDMAKELEAAGHDPVTIVQVIVKHLQTIATEVQQIIPTPTVATTPPAPPVG